MARDLLAEAMLRLEKAGLPIVCHVHDEVVLEVPEGVSSVEEVNGIMSVCPSWCEGLPLKAAGFESPFYKKGLGVSVLSGKTGKGIRTRQPIPLSAG